MGPRRMSREESWQSLHHSEASAENGDGEYSDISMGDHPDDSDGDADDTEKLIFPTVNDVRRALHPLQATADRLGKQVEEFSTSLDRLSTKGHGAANRDCRHALQFTQRYQHIANDTIENLKKGHRSSRRKLSSKVATNAARASSVRSSSRSRSAGREGSPTTEDDLRRWQEEEQTWDLLGRMLRVEYPVVDHPRSAPRPVSRSSPRDSAERPARSEVHPYSSEKEAWDNFLACDDQAWEQHTVIEWLQRCANNSRPDIETVIEELEQEGDRGGLWAHSWLYTKEAIKNQKRLRSWPQALDPASPGLDKSLINSAHEALVTQLDPDAVSRQGRKLEQQDESFERSLWLACWEMIRRGKQWQFVHDWCQDRGELWRAAAIRSQLGLHTDVCVNWQSQNLWRKACAVAARDCGKDDYEKAVYGALSGYLPSVQKISNSWDDFLFAHYNAYLVNSFDRFTKDKFADQYLGGSEGKDSNFNFSISGGQRILSGIQIIEKLNEQQGQEAMRPIKLLQGSLISGTFDDFATKYGMRLSRAANAETASRILEPLTAQILMQGPKIGPVDVHDYNLLRILTHTILIFQDLGCNFGEDGETKRHAIDSIVVAYIDFLGQAGKQQLLPLYASRLASTRQVTCLARQLPLILEDQERQRMMELMRQYGIDVVEVLSKQLQMIIEDTPETAQNRNYPYLKILEAQNLQKAMPRQIRPDFIGNDITNEQYDLIHGLDWFTLLDGYWSESMYIGVEIYKQLLRCGAFAAVRMLAKTVTFSKFSLRKSQKILGQVIDISKDYDIESQEVLSHRLGQQASPRKRSQRQGRPEKTERFEDQQRILLDESKSFRDFENFAMALDALEIWKDLALEAEQFRSRRQDVQKWSERKAPFKRACDEVELRVGRLLHGWLQSPRTDKEAEEFNDIRVACLPEVLLAYNTVLNVSAFYVSRDMLLKSMNLVPLIADKDSDLGRCIVESERMPELVDSFAWTSKNMILASEQGANKRKSTAKRQGECLDIWTIKKLPE